LAELLLKQLAIKQVFYFLLYLTSAFALPEKIPEKYVLKWMK